MRLRRALLKLFLTLLSFASMLLVKPVNAVILDYKLWLAFICAASALILDFKEYYRGFGYASTLTLNVISLVFLAFGRLGLTAMTFYASQFTAPLIGMIIVPVRGEYVYDYFYLMLGAGVVLALGIIVIHLLRGGPVALAESESYAQVIHVFNDWLKRLYSSAASKPIMAGFILGFGFRLLPEVYWWPWHIGWDTVEYLAHLRDFTTSLNPFQAYYWMGELRNVPPLMNILLAPFTALCSDWILMKLYPPICYGLLAASTAYLAANVLGLRGRCLLACILAAIFFILNLRISWDYQRQLLGSIFMVLAVAWLESNAYSSSLRKQVPPAFTLILAAMSHEVTAYLSAMLSLSAAGRSLLKEPRKAVAYITSASASIALLTWYAKGILWRSSIFAAVPAGVVSYGTSSIGESLAYLVAGYGPLMPFALAAFSGLGIYYKLAVLFLLAAGLSPMIAPMTAIATWYRFLIGASPLMIPLAFRGAINLSRRHLLAYLMFLILPGLCFYTPSGGESHAWKLISAIREFPSFMAPSPSSRTTLEELNNLSASIRNLGIDASIIVDAGTARWIHLGYRNPTPDQLIWIGRNPSLNDALNYMEKSGLTKVYLVTLKPKEALLQEIKENDNCSSLQIKTLRDGLYKIHEIRAS